MPTCQADASLVMLFTDILDEMCVLLLDDLYPLILSIYYKYFPYTYAYVSYMSQRYAFSLCNLIIRPQVWSLALVFQNGF